MKKLLFSLTLLVTLLTTQVTMAQAPKATPEEAITGLLTRIGGTQAPDRFEIVIDESLATNGKDIFVITSKNGKPCIKGNDQLSVATGINWYLNHYAHINLTWNNLTTDLSLVEFPVPTAEEVHECNTTYRYNFNTCTFSYSMAFWTWERWQQEIDWMALHGINAPLNLVGLDVVTRAFLRELKVSEADINAYIAGPGFIAWFAMNNLEGWGGTINSSSTGVNMSGNPDWWYARQEKLCKDMLQRMRELGMQPVIPGFSGQVPNCIVNYKIDGFSSGDVVNNGTWAGGYTRPDILKPNTTSYQTFAKVYYEKLHEIMGVSEFYSIDPFHEGALPGGVTNQTCYPNIMVELDNYFTTVSDDDKATYNVDCDPKWIIQYWQGVPQSGAFSSMASYGDRFIGLDLFSDNIYAGNAAKWRTDYFQGRPYIYCMLHNFGGRSGLHGRLETTMDGYFEALAKGNNMQGVGATPEGTETNPILYDMLFELPWIDPANRPTADEWLEDYAYSRYGVDPATAPNALAALQNLKKSVWDCKVNQQGTSEAVILARPSWSVNKVSSWSTSVIYWDTQDVLLAADQLLSVADLVTTPDGRANHNYDAIDVIRQAMVDYAAQLLPLINAARSNATEYERLYKLYLQLMLDLDTMLSYDENFKLERWTSLARNIADEGTALGYTTTDNDRNWLEWNARTQVTVWSKGSTDLHDYSNRCWAGLIKDFHYWRWKYFFENNGGTPSGGWFSGFEYPWTVDFNDTYSYAGDYSEIVIPTDITAIEKAEQTFNTYFGRVKGAGKNYLFPMGIATNGTKSDVVPELYRGQETTLPLEFNSNVTIASVGIDLNQDGAIGSNEAIEFEGTQITIPADATIGKTKATVTFSDGTSITFNLAIIEEITEARTVTAVAGENGTVAIEGTDELTVTNTEAVVMTATANTGYDFKNWTDADGNVVSNSNPYTYYAKEAATFTANFIVNKWGVVEAGASDALSETAKNNSFVHSLTFAYHNREAETIFETTTAPKSIFTTIPGIINVPRGASFDVAYEDGSKNGLQYCYFRAYIDLNQDGDFDDEGELLKTVGTVRATNTAVCEQSVNVLLPYDAPLGITHMRLRFDGAWDSPTSKNAKSASIRPVYDILINVTDRSNKSAHIEVASNNDSWGIAEVWTDETPGWVPAAEWDVDANIELNIKATKSSEDTEFLGWYDQYDRLLTTELEYRMYAREDATYTARFRKTLEIDGWEIEYNSENNKITLTKVLTVGNGELTIPETVILNGEQHTIVGLANGLFNNNTELTTINLPASMEFLSSYVVASLAVNGKGDNAADNSANYIKTNLGTTLAYSEDWSISMTVEDNGNNFNQWGSALLATDTVPMATTYSKGFQLYMKADGELVVKIGSAESKLFNLAKGTTYNIDVNYTASTKALVVTATNASGSSSTLNLTQSNMDSFSQVSHAIPAGVNITKLEISKGEKPCAFSGCSYLGAINVAEGGATYSSIDGCLYNADGKVLLCTPEGYNLHTNRSALKTAIDNMEELLAQVATTNANGTETALALTTAEGNDYYVWTNAPEANQGPIKNIVDNDASTFFHSNWSSTTAPADGLDHHITVDMGSKAIKRFKFSYQARSGIGFGDYPKTILVQGSTDGSNYTTIETITHADNAIPQNGAIYTSGVYESNTPYTNLRFMVTATSSNRQKDGHYYFHMAELDIWEITPSAIVNTDYASHVNNAQALAAFEALLYAQSVYANSTTAEDIQTAATTLTKAYNTLKANIPYNGVYKIKYKGNDTNIFIGYNDASGYTSGYKLLTSGTHAEGDEIAIIKPLRSGYSISMQGMYLKDSPDITTFPHTLFSENESDAGPHGFDTDGRIKNVVSTTSSNPKIYFNNFTGDIIGYTGNAATATFTITAVTKYPITVPESGVATLCLPFNVTLPTGVTAYDVIGLIDANKDSYAVYGVYALEAIATEGKTIKAGTPFIIKANAGDYTFTVTTSNVGAKGQSKSSLLRGNYIKTTLAASNNKYLLQDDGKTFKPVSKETEIAANSCWIESNVETAILLEEAFPFTITTDENDPAMYQMISRRDRWPEYGAVTHSTSSSSLGIAAQATNKLAQLWYFTLNQGYININPVTLTNDKVVGATSLARGEAISIVGENSSNTNWSIESGSETDYYHFYIADGSDKYYIFGGTGESRKYTIGINTASGDWGIMYKFQKCEKSKGYLYLNDYVSNNTVVTSTYVGAYGNANYDAALTTAKSQLAAGTATSKDMLETYNSLVTEGANLTINMPVEGKFYTIRSHYEESYYAYTNETNQVWYATEASKAIDSRHIWQFEGSVNGGLKLKSLHTQSYTPAVTEGNITLVAEGANITFIPSSTVANATQIQLGTAYMSFDNGDGNCQMKAWTAGEDVTGNLVYIEEANAEDIKYDATVSAAKFATLKLGYSTAIPEGVQAYTVAGVTNDGAINLEEVESYLPANTAVILYSETPATYTFAYDAAADAVVVDAESNMLQGSLVREAVACDDDKNYYMLMNGTKGVKMYWAYEEYGADGTITHPNTNDGGYILCPANRAYLPLEASTASNIASFSFNFNWGGTTGIDDVKTENGEVEAIFDLYGRRVTEAVKGGIYIINGKKVLVK